MHSTNCINFSLFYLSFVFISIYINYISKYKNSENLKLYKLEGTNCRIKRPKEKNEYINLEL